MTGRTRSPTIRDPTVPRRRIIWKTITVYSAVYQDSTGKVIVIRRTLEPPPPTRLFKGKGGVRKYKRIKHHQSTREVIIMARATKKKTKVEDIEDTELDELEGLEDLDELEDLDDLDADVEEDEDEDEDLEDDEDEDEDEDDDDDEDEEDEEPAPAPKRRGRPAGKTSASTKSKAPAKKTKKAVEKDFVSSSDVAEHLGVDTRTLRMVLRKHNIEKDPDSSRYQWSSLNHPTVKKIAKLIKSGEATNIRKEQLDKLKTVQAEKRAAKKAAPATKAKGKSKKRKAAEDE